MQNKIPTEILFVIRKKFLTSWGRGKSSPSPRNLARKVRREREREKKTKGKGEKRLEERRKMGKK